MLHRKANRGRHCCPAQARIEGCAPQGTCVNSGAWRLAAGAVTMLCQSGHTSPPAKNALHGCGCVFAVPSSVIDQNTVTSSRLNPAAMASSPARLIRRTVAAGLCSRWAILSLS